MGNEGSKLNGLIIEKNSVESNEFWKLYNAESQTTFNDEGCTQLLSIFQSKFFVRRHVWTHGMGPMERAIKNLMVYRHPSILKYVATWDQSGKKHIATERVRPLSEVLGQQSGIEICLGLRTILCGLIFLIETALARHLNISTHSIYVTDKGSWRLAGFQYVWRATEVNQQLIDLAHSFMGPNISPENFEQFFFAILCEQVLGNYRTETNDGVDIPYSQDFLTYCSSHMKHQNTKLRPRLSAILLHPFFNHEFVLIHSFLVELPLKSVHERQKFFENLIERLRIFHEQVVASQLACNLLSRMVLLDITAQKYVTPYILRVKTMDKAIGSLFSSQIYVQYLMPQILKMFRLRDAQIRLILLDYFMDYVPLLSNEQLLNDILPHLQLAMRDTNSILVAKTLRCMADLVPILGANKVLGGDRVRCFSDGRPHAAVLTNSQNSLPEPRSISPLINTRSFDAEEDFMVSGSPLPTDNNVAPSSLRLSPDGGEDENTDLSKRSDSVREPSEYATGKSLCLDREGTCSDWVTRCEHQLSSAEDNTVHNFEINSRTSTPKIQTTRGVLSLHYAYPSHVSLGINKSLSQTERSVIDDLSALDIQVHPVNDISELSKMDFFKDMEPIIEIQSNSCDTAKSNNTHFAALNEFTKNVNDVDCWSHDEHNEDDI